MFLIAGVSSIARVAHAVPYASGVPTVVCRRPAWCSALQRRQILFYLVQAGAITILFTGGTPASAASRS